jgi:hypothetical protein
MREKEEEVEENSLLSAKQFEIEIFPRNCLLFSDFSQQEKQISLNLELFLAIPVDCRGNKFVSACDEEEQFGEESKSENSSVRLQSRCAAKNSWRFRQRLHQRITSRCKLKST